MDTSSPLAIGKAILPKVPLLISNAVWHSVGLSKNSKKWDLKTEIAVSLVRALINNPKPSPISKQQVAGSKDPGIKGPMWISKVVAPTPEEDARIALVNAIEALKEKEEIYTVPDIKPVEAEWTGYRAGVDSNRPRLDLSEVEHYGRLMKEVKSDVTILYFHGGAYYLMDPISHRIPCSKLAKLTGGRCLSVRYRLAPQNAFPSALLDAFISYLYLLSPPPGSFHEPVPAEHIVFSGDSAGGGLAMALLQLILQLHRSSSSQMPTIRFHGQDVRVPIPAGVSLVAGWFDITRCLPSLISNAHYDYLPPPKSGDLSSYFPKCPVWPTDPPRGDLYCDVSMLCHPLVSPIAAKDWKGACPVRLAYGTEMLLDEGKVVAQNIAQQGGTVIWEEYDAMPHCFCMILEALEGSKICYESWAQFANDVVEGKELESKGTFIEAKTYKRIKVDVLRLETFQEGEVESLMKQARSKRSRGEEGEAKALPKM